MGPPRVRCTAAAFSFGEIETTDVQRQGNLVYVAWRAHGSTMLDCPSHPRLHGQVMGIDTWEHAYVVVDPNGDGDLQMAGRIRLGVRIPDGGSVIIGGLMRGEGPCIDEVCIADGEGRASTPGGKARMRERVTIDLAAGEVTSIDVQGIVIDFTGAR